MKWTREQVLSYVRDRGRYGATSLEVEKAADEGHGPISGRLSTLHREGRLVLTIGKRAGYGVYKAPEHVLAGEGRKAHAVNKPCPHCGHVNPHEQEEPRAWQE